ncbi:MAG: WG repeat-containing protein [Saprospiraceae bacterium]|nr:WG repeat-containing protein [Saprospiraceae bacterium]
MSIKLHWSLIGFVLFSLGLKAQDRVFPYSFANLYGLVSDKNEVVLKEKYQSIQLNKRQWDNNKFVVFSQLFKNGNTSQEKYGILDNTGKEIIPAKLSKIYYDFYGRFFYVLPAPDSMEIWHIAKKKCVLRTKFASFEYDGGLFVVKDKKGSSTILLDNGINKLISKNVDIVNDMYKFYYSYYDEGIKKYQYITDKGKPAPIEDPLGYDDFPMVQMQHSDLQSLISEKNGQLNALKSKLGTQNVKPFYSRVGDFPLVAAYTDPATKFLKLYDLTGEILLDKEGITQMESFKKGSEKFEYIKYKIGNYWGLTDFNGKQILSPEYSSIEISEEEDYYFFVRHKSGYSGYCYQGQTPYLPKESGCTDLK